MLFAVLFVDNADSAQDIRRRYMPAHLDFLERNGSAIKAAGPLSDEHGIASGGLWLVEAADRGQVEQLVRTDPFWPTGLRDAVRVLVWNQVFADGLRRDVQG